MQASDIPATNHAPRAVPHRPPASYYSTRDRDIAFEQYGGITGSTVAASFL